VSVGKHRSPPRRDWDAEPNVLRARVLLADDKCRAAVKEAWKAALVAVNADDDDGLAVVRTVALEIQERATGRARDEAEVLASYVDHCRDTAASGVPQGSLLARLFGVRKAPRTKTCPRCAEQVRERARVCRFCNHEFPDP
jgi:hypothetical protein